MNRHGSPGRVLGILPVSSQYESVRTREPGERALRAAHGGDAPDDLGTTVYDVARDLRRDVEQVKLPLDVAGRPEAMASRDRLLTQLDEHLLPRLKELSSPAVVVVAGSTGAGKSTLYNSILGEEVSAAGVLRPTTREPVFAYNPLDADVLVEGPTTRMSRVVEHDGVPRGTALLDAPDLDSLLAENRDTAALLLEAADLWLFVTTAARYGDALPWQTLNQARERGASVAMVLNRVPRANLTTIRGDLLARLREHGMEGAPLFVIPDAGPHEGLLDRGDVAPIARWLTLLAGPDRSRSVIVRTLKGSLAALPAWVTGMSEAVEAQVSAAGDLRAAVTASLPDAVASARKAVTSGAVARGSLASRWAQVSAERLDRVKVRGGVARSSRRKGRLRDVALGPLRDEVQGSARRTLTSAGAKGEEAVRDALLGARLLPGAGPLPGAATVLPDPEERATARESAAGREVDAWVAGADKVVAGFEAGTRAEQAAARAFGPRGLAAVLLAAAAGNDDAEHLTATVLAAEGTAVVDALRSDLADRAAALVGREAEPVLAALDVPALAGDADVGLRLRLAELRRLM